MRRLIKLLAWVVPWFGRDLWELPVFPGLLLKGELLLATSDMFGALTLGPAFAVFAAALPAASMATAATFVGV